MDLLNKSLQLSRVAASTILTIQAVTTQWIVFLDEKDQFEKEHSQKTTFEQRLKWDTYVANNQRKHLFKRHLLRMSYDSFRTLFELISSHLKDVDRKMANLHGGEVIKELRLYATLCYLAGASYSVICFFC
jgi:hypothetical protein